MKTVFSTGEAARICKLSQQTIIRCFDSGYLKGFRVPGSRFRRIPRAELYKFMKQNGIPTDALNSGKRRLLIIDGDTTFTAAVGTAFARDGRFDVRVADKGFAAGMLIEQHRPDLVVLDTSIPGTEPGEVCRLIRSDPSLDGIRIVCIRCSAADVSVLQERGADVCLPDSCGVAELVETVCRLQDIEPIESEAAL